MATERFVASVQYGGLKGASTADRADKNSAESWLETNGHKQKGEFLLGISMTIGENHGVHEDPIYVTFLLAEPGDYDGVRATIDATDQPIETRRVNLQMPLAEFFGLFKRFSVTLSPDGMLCERQYRYAAYGRADEVDGKTSYCTPNRLQKG